MGTKRCPHCGAEIPAEEATCRFCGQNTAAAVQQPMGVPAGQGPQQVAGTPPPGSYGYPAAPGPQKALGDDAGMRMLLPVGRSGLAIIAGYLGLLSIILVPAPLALIVGIMAVVDIKKNPKKHGLGRAVFAIIMGAIFSTLLLIIFIT